MDRDRPPFSLQAVLRETGISSPGLIEELGRPIASMSHHDRRDGIDCQLKLSFGLPLQLEQSLTLLLCSLAILYVQAESVPPGDVALLVHQWHTRVTSDIPHQKLGGNAPRPRMAGRSPGRHATISTSARSLRDVSQSSTPSLPCPARKARYSPSSVYSRMSASRQAEQPPPSPALFRSDREAPFHYVVELARYACDPRYRLPLRTI
jgi:hypothetical protein